MSFYGDAPAELIYAMPGVGGAVSATISTGTAAAGPQLGGGGANSTTIPACELPHNYFSKVGKSILIEGGGIFATAASGNGNMNFGMYYDNAIGGSSGLTLIAKTGAFAQVASVTGNWYFRLLVTCTATGSSGTLQAIGVLNWGPNALTVSTANTNTYLLGASSTTPVSFNTVQSTPVYLEPLAFYSATTTAQTITMTNMFVWGLN